MFGAFTSWPSAGALYPLHVFAVLYDVDSPMAGRVVHYERDAHGLSDVGPAPTWDEAREPLGGTVLDGAPPSLVVVFVLDTAGMEAKYGNRGARFALIEVGAVAQSLSLQVAASGLAGCLLGGAYDRAVASMLGLDRRGGPPLLVPLAYACGLPVSRPTKRFGRAPSRSRD